MIVLFEMSRPTGGALLNFSEVYLKANTTLSGYFVEGKLKNGAAKTLESFVLNLQFVRSNGVPLDATEANCFLIDVSAGESKTFTAYLAKAIDVGNFPTGWAWNYSLKSTTFRSSGSTPAAEPLAAKIIGDWFNSSASNTLRFGNGGQFAAIVPQQGVGVGHYWFVGSNLVDIHFDGLDERTNEMRLDFFSKDELIVTRIGSGETGELYKRISTK